MAHLPQPSIFFGETIKFHVPFGFFYRAKIKKNLRVDPKL